MTCLFVIYSTHTNKDDLTLMRFVLQSGAGGYL